MEPEQHTFSVGMECRCLVRVPDPPPGGGGSGAPLVVAALHGHGMNAAEMLRLTSGVVPETAVIASLQAPYQQFLSSDYANAKVGYNWGSRDHHAANVALHHRMLLRLLGDLRARFGAGPGRIALLGFSQAAGFNYRFAATYPDEVRGVIGLCGGVPKDWESPDSGYHVVPAALLHVARDQDEYFPPEVTAAAQQRLRHRASDVTVHRLPGPHRFPSAARPAILEWIERVFGAPAA
jgi:predicted esterase